MIVDVFVELKMENREYVELRSEDVQEILGTPPGWLVRWGTTVVLFGCLMMLLAAWFVRYPDVVDAKVVMTTANPPVDVVARANGRIAMFFVEDKAKVAANQPLALLQSTASYQNIKTLDSLLDIWQPLAVEGFRQVEAPDGLKLGELQSDYADFSNNLEIYKFGRTNKTATTNSNLGAINLQIKQLDQSISFDRKAMSRVQDQLGPAEEIYKKQKELYDQGITSRVDFEKERTKLAELERQNDQYEDNIIRKQNEIISLRRSMSDVSFNREESESNTGTRLRSSLNTLRSSLDKWKQNYIISAPIDGFVSKSATFYSAQMFVSQGDLVLTVVPAENGNIVGRLLLPVAGSGKVKQGQRVIIKLESYPYHEFGALKGVVVSKSLVPKDDQYAILVGIPRSKTGNLTSTYNKEIPFEQQLQGRAEIITEDKGLLERIGDQLFANIR